MTGTLGNLLLIALEIFQWIIIIQVVMSWLVAFEVINVRNPQGQNLMHLLARATDWIYQPLRKFIPPIGGIDITPIIVIIGIQLARKLVFVLFTPYL